MSTLEKDRGHAQTFITGVGHPLFPDESENISAYDLAHITSDRIQAYIFAETDLQKEPGPIMTGGDLLIEVTLKHVPAPGLHRTLIGCKRTVRASDTADGWRIRAAVQDLMGRLMSIIDLDPAFEPSGSDLDKPHP